MAKEKLKCACGKKGRLIVACRACCSSDCFPDYTELESWTETVEVLEEEIDELKSKLKKFGYVEPKGKYVKLE